VKANNGEYLQDKLAAAMKDFTTNHRGYGHRFPDTKSAQGNFIKAQPGDFFLLVPQGSILIECKSTVSNASLLSLAWHGDVGKRQIAKHKLWQRAGHPSVYLYGNLSSGKRTATYEWHCSSKVIQKVATPLLIGEMASLTKSIPALLTLLTY
jgi:hypothetical protein